MTTVEVDTYGITLPPRSDLSRQEERGLAQTELKNIEFPTHLGTQ